jgi:carbon storage regulator CsrA
MLVITRKCEQEVFIGEHVRLKVLAVRGNRVQLGIAAPRDVAVHRAEHVTKHPAAVDDTPAVKPHAVRVPA